MATEHRKQLMREYNRRYRERHPDRRKASLVAYNRSDKAKANRQRWIEANTDMDAASKKKYYEQHKEENAESAREYARLHPWWKAAHCAKRRATKLKAMPVWLDEDDLWLIEEIHELAQLRSKYTGIKHVVDHIVPLQGKAVCGLHVPWNMRVITASENSHKGNRFDANQIN